MSKFSDDFMWGQRDCREGVPAMVNASDDYNRGYGSQYEAEALLSEMGINQDRKMGVAL